MSGGKTIVIPAPSPTQRRFFADTHKFVAFGGARGGGKSWAVRVKAILLALNYPGIKIMIVRRSYPELRANHIKPMREMIGTAAVYKETTKEITFPNGSVITFRYCSGERDLEKYQGTETDVLFLDEATQLTEGEYERFSACVRGANDFPKRIYLTCNPGGRGHAWVKRLFIDRCFREDENPEDYSFIKSRVTDNAALLKSDPGYLERLRALPDKLKKAWLDGDWDIFEGRFFEEFRNEEKEYREAFYTHVIKPFDIPPTWEITRSFDFGYARPFSCDWWATDFDGRTYLILQLYGCTGNPNEGVKWSPERIFAKIKEIEDTHPYLRGKAVNGVADPSIWDASRGEAIVETADRFGVYFEKGDNRRIPGWMQCHNRLAFDENGRPGTYFFSSCKDAIRTLPLLEYSQTCPEDLDTAQEDHFADSFRYFCMSRPVPAVEKIQAASRGDDPLDLRK